MTREEHIEKHVKLHQSLDELIADWVTYTKCFPSKNTVYELIQWSHKQTTKPDKE